MLAFIPCTEFTRSRGSPRLWGLEAWDGGSGHLLAHSVTELLPLSFS